MSKTRRGARGFTLVEVLVALLIMALMAMMSWRGLDAIIRTRDISQAHLERTMRLQTVMAQWEQDLLAVQVSGAVPPLQFTGGSLQLTRLRAEGMQVVVWSRMGNAWTRWESPVTTSAEELRETYMRSLQLQANAPGMVRALEGVSGWQVYFYRGNSWSNAQSSSGAGSSAPTPPSAGASDPPPGPGDQGTRPPLPTAVKMALQFDEASGWSGTLNRAVALGPQP
ncbi:prepilin-type N-terminal cleavage/methylation domain-containing protein [Roseateles toxinivorans]|uniref:General secretion pathway protein J n=1 Tax=Roseateles toxinivorans TaxID=270368 RepID=A0A4R6QJT1_9BURK|nr:prepilin-type N-terminal cleavage/methylation domain-containing protein [Roseateles toxinivorans]TDP62749.1 general secretion pathway protein J [Roseateles toxinivorans]